MSIKQIKPTYENLPIDPENNPPETIDEIETLIGKLQNKSASIKQQLEVVVIREKQGLPVDYTRVKRSIFARAQTNKSISALQVILKKKKQATFACPGNSFEKFFFAAAKDSLSSDVFSKILEHTYTSLRQAESSALKEAA